MCKHFHENEFVADSTVSHAKRKEERDSTKFKQSRLKPSAVPQKFPDLPSHLYKLSILKRYTILSTVDDVESCSIDTLYLKQETGERR